MKKRHLLKPSLILGFLGCSAPFLDFLFLSFKFFFFISLLGIVLTCRVLTYFFGLSFDDWIYLPSIYTFLLMMKGWDGIDRKVKW